MLLLRMVKITTVEKSKSDIITLMAHCPSQNGNLSLFYVAFIAGAGNRTNRGVFLLLPLLPHLHVAHKHSLISPPCMMPRRASPNLASVLYTRNHARQ
jgi:hypothetical protein